MPDYDDNTMKKMIKQNNFSWAIETKKATRLTKSIIDNFTELITLVEKSNDTKIRDAARAYLLDFPTQDLVKFVKAIVE